MAPAISPLRLGTQAVLVPGGRAPRLLPVDFAAGLHLPWPLLSTLISILIILVNSWEWAFQGADFLGTLSPELIKLRNPIVEEFDFIVVGGGSAGAIVANRLSKYPGNSVLLLEAGGKPNPYMLWPAMAYLGQLRVSGVDWMFETVPQPNSSLGLNEQRVLFPRGKGLGGSSNLNLMYYQRGNRRDYDRWAEVTGDPEWNFENMLKAFKSTVNYHGNNPSEKFHEKRPHDAEGLFVGKTIPYGIKEWLSAAKEKGFHVEDPNAIQRESFSRMDVTIKDGKRFGTYAAFLQGKTEARRNLKIYLYSRAIKVHLDHGRVAYGVTYLRHGITRFVRAKREIILSAGAIDTPRLMLLSGIGPKKDLHKVGLKCRVNLPVGRNMQDHALTIVGPFTVQEGKATSFFKESNIVAITDYFGRQMGFISTPDSSSGVGYVCSSLAEKDWPDVQYTLIGAATTIPILSMAHNFKPGLWEKYSSPYLTQDSFGVAIVSPGLPRSRGVLRLKSRFYQDKPLIDPRYFSHPDDMRITVDGMRILIDLIENSTAYREIHARFATTPLPGCEQFRTIRELRSDAYYECYLRQLTFTVHHPCCTVPMGRDWRDGQQPTVLDSNLRVFKTRHLRVMDASIMPYITNANLNAPTIAIGEKGAAFVREYWAEQFLICEIIQFLTFRENRGQCFYSRLV